MTLKQFANNAKTVHQQRQTNLPSTQERDCPPLASCFGPPPRTTTSSNVTHDASGTEICKRYNIGNALSPTACMPTRAGHLAAMGNTWAKGVQSTPNELSRALTPLQQSQFEHKLAGHHVWVSKMLIVIKIGVRIGHTDPQHYAHACNLSSSFQIIDKELAKERDASLALSQAGVSMMAYTQTSLPLLQLSG